MTGGDPYRQGYEHAARSLRFDGSAKIADNPYPLMTTEAGEWIAGFCDRVRKALYRDTNM